MLDLVPTNDAIRPVGDGWDYRHNHIDDLSLYTDHCRIRRIPIVAMRPYHSDLHGTLEEPHDMDDFHALYNAATDQVLSTRPIGKTYSLCHMISFCGASRSFPG